MSDYDRNLLSIVRKALDALEHDYDRDMEHLDGGCLRCRAERAARELCERAEILEGQIERRRART
jgi:hypothetical protein